LWWYLSQQGRFEMPATQTTSGADSKRTGVSQMIYTAKDIMSRNFVTLSPDMDVLEAVHLLVRHNISGSPVVDKLGNLVGVLSEIDCMKAAVQASYHGSKAGRVSELMRKVFETVDVDDSIMSVAKKFASQQHHYYRGYPVMKQNRVVGKIILRDVLKAMTDMSDERN
jgi:predicted transcriptional regulator